MYVFTSFCMFSNRRFEKFRERVVGCNMSVDRPGSNPAMVRELLYNGSFVTRCDPTHNASFSVRLTESQPYWEPSLNVNDRVKCTFGDNTQLVVCGDCRRVALSMLVLGGFGGVLPPHTVVSKSSAATSLSSEGKIR